MENNYISVCLLSYNRLDFLKECIETLHKNMDYPCEIILHDESTDGFTKEANLKRVIGRTMRGEDEYSPQISYSIFNSGLNMGVGHAFDFCTRLASGKYILKCDTDNFFKPHALSTMVKILDNNSDIGCVSPFDYRKIDPTEKRFNKLEERTNCFIVDDFVSSIYMFRRSDLLKMQPIEDDGNHLKLGKVAITKEDFIENTGFGRNSVYVSFDKEGKPYKTPTHNEPLIFRP